MQVKTVDATTADQLSAKLLFRTLFDLSEVYWPELDKKDLAVRVLEPFARNGQLTIKSYSDDYRVCIEAWELSKEHQKALAAIPEVYSVTIGCSYQSLEKYWDRLQEVPPDLIVIDTPQGIHTDGYGKKHAEHFDFLEKCLKLYAKSGGVIVLYVNTDPYDARQVGEHGYDTYKEYDFAEWMSAREKFYRSTPVNKAGDARPVAALSAYEDMATYFGLRMSHPLMIPCMSDVPGKAPYAFRLAFRVDPRE